ncbi:MAG: Brp/Blh family beta-carotene 15,15'-dioxygenase, partial [Pseudomonadota bacterium]|nr:Brp/Blh family beta-carotene 15,15'-dioxygenase [Pseudomonadota bacterium]
WHFGTEDRRSTGVVSIVAWGGMPIAAPLLLQPAATMQVLSAIAGVPLVLAPPLLLWCSLVWLIAFGVTAARCGWRDLGTPAALCVGFALLPPLTSFTLYFVAAHAPAHVDALIRHRQRAPRVCDRAAAWRLALPTTVLTVVIGAALWPLYPGPVTVRLVCVTLQLLAGLTLPHMLLEAWLDRADAAGRGSC